MCSKESRNPQMEEGEGSKPSTSAAAFGAADPQPICHLGVNFNSPDNSGSNSGKLADPLTHPLTHSRTNYPTHSRTYAPTHPLTHALTHSWLGMAILLP